MLGLVVLGAIFIGGGGPGFDFYAYWAVDPFHPYGAISGLGAFHYSPPLAWLAAPLRPLPWELGYWIWTAANVITLIALTRRWAAAWLAFPPVASELYHGNVHILMAGALVAGFRYPALWAFLPLAKITPAIIGLWLVVRRKWRHLAVLVGTGAIVSLLSFVVAPAAWFEWLPHLLEREAEGYGGGARFGIPLFLRLPFAIAIILWAARSSRRWPMAVAVTLALPILWIHGLAILVALQPLVRNGSEARAASAGRKPRYNLEWT